MSESGPGENNIETGTLINQLQNIVPNVISIFMARTPMYMYRYTCNTHSIYTYMFITIHVHKYTCKEHYCPIYVCSNCQIELLNNFMHSINYNLSKTKLFHEIELSIVFSVLDYPRIVSLKRF